MDGHPAIVVFAEHQLERLMQREPLLRWGGGPRFFAERRSGSGDQRLKLASALVEVGQFTFGVSERVFKGRTGLFKKLSQFRHGAMACRIGIRQAVMKGLRERRRSSAADQVRKGQLSDG